MQLALADLDLARASAQVSHGLHRLPQRVDRRVGDLGRVQQDVVEYDGCTASVPQEESSTPPLFAWA